MKEKDRNIRIDGFTGALLSLNLGTCSTEVMQAIAYIEENFSEIRHVSEIANNLSLNYHTLRDRFRRETRLRLKDFLTRVRIIRALKLLTETDKLIKEIAWEVGYNHEGQLVRAFRKYLEMTPQIIRTQDRVSHHITEALELAKELMSSKKPLRKVGQR